MSSLQGPVICPVVRVKQTSQFAVPVNSSVMKAKILKSGFLGLNGISSCRINVVRQPRSRLRNVISCSFSSSSNGNGSTAENSNENDADYVNSSVVEAVEVRSGPDGFMIKMRDGRQLRCVQNNTKGGHLPDCAPHPVIVLRMEDGTGLLLPIIVLETSSLQLMAAVCNIHCDRPTMYQVVNDMVENMGYTVKLVRVTKRVHEAYYAQLYLAKSDNDAEIISFDLRPSDAINIAVRSKVPIQVNKYLAYTDGMRIVETPKPAVHTTGSDGLLFTELDKPSGQPCVETKEFILVRNMLIAAVEERYRDAGKYASGDGVSGQFTCCSSNFCIGNYSTMEGQAYSTALQAELDITGARRND